MPAERTTMRQVREVLRLTTAGVGLNEIARRVGVAPSTVRLTLKRLASAGLRWPWAPPTSLMPRRAGPRHCPTGSSGAHSVPRGSRRDHDEHRRRSGTSASQALAGE